MTQNQLEATQAELDQAKQRATQRSTYDEWNTYANKVAKPYALFLVALVRADDAIEASNLPMFKRSMREAGDHIEDAISIKSDRGQCREVNIQLGKLLQANDYLIRNIDNDDVRQYTWDEMNEQWDQAKHEIDWLIEQ